MNCILVSPPNSYVDTLIPKVMIFGDGSFGCIGFPHYPKVERSFEIFISQNGEEAITLGHTLLTNAQDKLR